MPHMRPARSVRCRRAGRAGVGIDETETREMEAKTTTRLAEAIREARGTRSRRALAIELDVTEKTIYSWETGATRPNGPAHIRKLAAIGVPLELLLADDEGSDAAGGR